MNALSKPKPAPGRADLSGRGPTTGPEGENTMTAINPIGSMTSTSPYQPAATSTDQTPKQDATRKAGHHGHHGGHRAAEGPAPAPTTPDTSTSTSSILDVTA
jgi:hypothetical protein